MRNTDFGLLILRLSIAGLMLFHGFAKFGSIGFIENLVASKGLPSFFAYGVFVGEIIAPLFMIFGFRTRLASLVYVFNCIVAFLLAHTGDFFTLTKHGGWGLELLGLFTFGALALVFTGGGKLAFSTNNKWD